MQDIEGSPPLTARTRMPFRLDAVHHLVFRNLQNAQSVCQVWPEGSPTLPRNHTRCTKKMASNRYTLCTNTRSFLITCWLAERKDARILLQRERHSHHLNQSPWLERHLPLASLHPGFEASWSTGRTRGLCLLNTRVGPMCKQSVRQKHAAVRLFALSPRELSCCSKRRPFAKRMTKEFQYFTTNDDWAASRKKSARQPWPCQILFSPVRCAILTGLFVHSWVGSWSSCRAAQRQCAMRHRELSRVKLQCCLDKCVH